MAVRQAQTNMGVTNMLYPKNLNLITSQTQDNMDLMNISDPKSLDLKVS